MDTTYYGNKKYINLKNSTFSVPGMTETMSEWKTQNPKACSAA